MTSNAPDYERMHFGWVVACVAVPLLALFAWTATSLDDEVGGLGVIAMWIVVVLAAAAVLLFTFLTVRVDDEGVAVWFGLGWPRTAIRFGEIRAVAIVKRSWLWGYGLRFTTTGWLWRASGVHAVEIVRERGKSTFIGTDDPEALAAAIRRRL